jgi:hypothetical protein
MRRFTIAGLLVAATLMLVAGVGRPPTQVTASSHREAPLIANDPTADNTDTYIFTSPDKPDTVTIIACYIPLEFPGAGPYYYRFGDDVRYSINIDNNGSGTGTIRYDFDFVSTVRDPNELLYNTGPVTAVDDKNLNIVQSYTVTRTDANGSNVLGSGLPVAPYYVGGLAYPQGYDSVGNQAIKQLSDGSMVFAGPRADPFFVDVGAVFDLVNIRKPPGNTGGGVNALAGLNVHAIALQVPKSLITSSGQNPSGATDPAAVVGVWATSSRRTTTVLNRGTSSGSGDFVQVSRLGMPLFNEAVIPVGLKDRWNAGTPQDTIQFDAQFGGDPEITVAMNSIYKIKIPPQPKTGGPVRDDLAAIFLTGIPNLTKPSNANAQPAEEMRINLGVPPSGSPNRMGVLAMDAAGFPNGRRLADDVVDIELQALAGAAYPLFHMDYTPDPLASQLGDGVDGPDKPYATTFPYVASPYSGDTGPFRGQATATP